jgi:hypothetical protein
MRRQLFMKDWLDRLCESSNFLLAGLSYLRSQLFLKASQLG